MRRPVVLAAISLALATVSGSSPNPPATTTVTPAVTTPAPQVADPISHDPTIVKEGRYYYDIYTHSVAAQTYLPQRRSTDLVHWTALAPIFAAPPAWVAAELGFPPADLWAPEVSYFAGEYHLYYAASKFGTNESVIGMATSRTLDPDSPAYGWVDRGLVLRSGPADDFNAIDPDVVLDGARVPWMSFGSFWDGIKMRRLDPRTGLLSTSDTTLYALASRGGGAIEAASVLHRGGYYYLFVSFDYCCRKLDSDYRVMMGRSRSVTGPYLDRRGVDLRAGGGSEILSGYGRFIGPGHGDAFSVGGVDWYVHHYYDATDAGLPKLSVRRITWTAGWPTLGDPLSGNRGLGHGNAYVTLVDRRSGAVLANPTCGYEGADIRLGDRPADECQQWRLEEHDPGWSSLLNRASNKVAEVAACVDAEGARVAQWGWLHNNCQQFRLLPTDAGYVRIESKLAGRVLGVAGCGGVGASVQTVTYTGAACQQFRVAPVGAVLLVDRADAALLTGSACGSGAAVVVQHQRRPGNCQLWLFRPAGDGYFAIVHRQTGRALAVTGRPGASRIALVRPSAASRWRIESLGDGTWRLVTADGVALQLAGSGARPGVPGAGAAQQFRILQP